MWRPVVWLQVLIAIVNDLRYGVECLLMAGSR
jgi:hypothetical protein